MLRPMYIPRCATLTAKLQFAYILVFSTSTGDMTEQQLTNSSINNQMHLNFAAILFVVNLGLDDKNE